MSAALYTTDILRMAANIPYLGRLAQPDHSIQRRSAVCGSRITIDLKLNAYGQIAEFAQEVHACALGQAAAYVLGEHVIGRSAAELAETAADLAAWLAGSRDEVPQWPGLNIFEPAKAHKGRHNAICLPFEAAAAAAAGVVG